MRSALQNGGRKWLPDRASNAFELRSRVIAILLNGMKQQNDAKDENKHHGDGCYHRHLFDS